MYIYKFFWPKSHECPMPRVFSKGREANSGVQMCEV